MKTRAALGLTVIAAAFVGVFAQAVSADYVSAVLDDNPVAYWRLGEASGNFASQIGSYAGTDAGHDVARDFAGPQSPTYIGFGAGNKGIDVNNTPGNVTATDYISVTHNTVLNPGAGNWSMEAWVWVDALQGNEGYIVSKMDGSRNGYGLSLSAANGPTVTFRQPFNNEGFPEEVVALGASALSLNTWHHIVGTINRNATATQDRLTLYVDGDQKNTLLSDKIFGWSLTPSTALTIGSLGTTYGLKGAIDEVPVYSTALTADQVAAHYDAAFTAIPEPGSMLMLGSGVLLGFLAYAWRKRR